MVTNGDEAPAVPFFDAQVNAPPVGAVAQGVVDQVEECLVQPSRFNADLSGLVAFGLDREFDAPRDRKFLQGRPGLTNDVPGVEGCRWPAAAGQGVVQSREIQQVAHQFLQSLELFLQAPHEHRLATFGLE